MDGDSNPALTRQLTGMVQRMQTEKAALVQENAALKADIDRAAQDNRELKINLRKLSARMTEMLEEREDLLRTLSASQIEMHQTSERKAKVDTQVAELQQRIATLEEERKAQDEVNWSLQEEVQRLTDERQALEERRGEERTREEQRRHEISHLKQSRNEFQREASALRLIAVLSRNHENAKRTAFFRWQTSLFASALIACPSLVPTSSTDADEHGLNTSRSSDGSWHNPGRGEGEPFESDFSPPLSPLRSTAADVQQGPRSPSSHSIQVRWDPDDRLQVRLLRLGTALRKSCEAVRRGEGRAAAAKKTADAAKAQVMQLQERSDNAEQQASSMRGQLLVLEAQLMSEQRRGGVFQAQLNQLLREDERSASMDNASGDEPGDIEPGRRRRCGRMCALRAADVQALKTQTNTMSETIQLQQDTIAKLREDVTRATDALKGEEARRNTIQAALKRLRMLYPKDVDSTVALLSSTLAASTPTSVATLGAAPKELLNELAGGEGTSSSSYSQQSLLFRTISLLQHRIDTAAAEVAEVTQREERVRIEKQALQNQLAQYAATVSRMDNELSGAQADAIRAESTAALLAADVSVKDTLLQDLQHQLAECAGVLQVAQEQGRLANARENMSSEQVRTLQLELQDASRSLSELATTCAGLEQEVERLHGAASRADELQERLLVAMKNLQELQQDRHALRMARDRTAHTLQQVHDQHGRGDDDKVAQLETEVSQLKQKVAETQTLRDMVVDLQQQVVTAQAIIADKISEASQHSSNLQLAKELMQQMEAMISTQTQSLSSAQGVIAAKDAEVESLLGQLRDLREATGGGNDGRDVVGVTPTVRSHLQLMLQQLSILVSFARSLEVGSDDVEKVLDGFGAVASATQHILEGSSLPSSMLRTPPKASDQQRTGTKDDNDESTSAPPLELQDSGTKAARQSELSVSFALPKQKPSPEPAPNDAWVGVHPDKLAAAETIIGQQSKLIASLRASLEEWKAAEENASYTIQELSESMGEYQERVVVLATAMEQSRRISEQDTDRARYSEIQARKLLLTQDALSALLLPLAATAAQVRAQNAETGTSSVWTLQLAPLMMLELLALLVPDVFEEFKARFATGEEPQVESDIAEACLALVQDIHHATQHAMPRAFTGEAMDADLSHFTIADVQGIAALQVRLQSASEELAGVHEDMRSLHSRNSGLSNELEAVLSECLRLTDEVVSKTEELSTSHLKIRELADMLRNAEFQLQSQHATPVKPVPSGRSAPPAPPAGCPTFDAQGQPAPPIASPLGRAVAQEKMRIMEPESPLAVGSPMAKKPMLANNRSNDDEDDAASSDSSKPLPTLAELASDTFTLDS